MNPTFYLAEFMTGNFLGPALPLDAASLSSNFQPGQFSASLDMRKIARTFKESRTLLDMMKAGKATLIPVVETTGPGHRNPAPPRVLGEWWISKLESTYSDPVVRLSGPEWIGYAKETMTTRSWVGKYDVWTVLRQLLGRIKEVDQTIQLTLGTRQMGVEIDVDIREGDQDYWSAIQSLQDGSDGKFEWRIEPELRYVDGVARGVTRTLRMAAPDFRVDRTDVTLELVTPGSTPATLTDFSRAISEHQSASTVYGRGAGMGDSQLRASSSRGLEDGEPAKTRLLTVSDAVKLSVLRRATRSALRSQRALDQVFQVTMPTDWYTPVVGEVYSWRREPSWSMPETHSAEHRCVGWSWTSGQPGTHDTYTLDLVEG
ncbi:hypothetical protein ACTXM8_04730 [Brachybacterium alimentarium]|uniref:hypothetical protein n=1 Tax=Brachybacterium alimentarium TaxID=47845 RepID=UPI003FD62D37